MPPVLVQNTLNAADTESRPDAFSSLVVLLRDLVESGLPLIPLRPKAVAREQAFSGDYDYLVARKARSKLVSRVRSTLTALGASFLVARNGGERVKLYIYDFNRRQAIVVEFWFVFLVNDPRDRYPCWQKIYWENIESAIERDEAGYRLQPAIAGLLYLSHLHTMGKSLSAKEVSDRLHYFQQTAGSEPWRSTNVSELLASVSSGNRNISSAAAEACSLLEMHGLYRRKSSLLSYVADALVARLGRIRRSLVQAAPSVVFAGPDGTGKTALSYRVAEQLFDSRVSRTHFKSVYRHTFAYKVLSLVWLLGKWENNRFDEIFHLPIFFISLVVFIFRCRSIEDQPVRILDRYFYDLLLANMNTDRRPGRLCVWWRIGVLLSPRPHCIINLDIPYPLSLARKGELCEADWALYKRLMCRIDLIKPSPYSAYLRNDFDLDGALEFVEFVLRRAAVLRTNR